ncbi:3-deoxy-7-phosphoheptulonate synthase, partial [Acinetobacter baumannii]
MIEPVTAMTTHSNSVSKPDIDDVNIKSIQTLVIPRVHKGYLLY